jgi:hypothetical protein
MTRIRAAILLLLAAAPSAAAEPPGNAVGRAILPAPPPREPTRRACSFRTPICVHARRAAEEKVALDVLASAERSWWALTGPLDLPAPDPSVETGRLDVYLADDVDEGAAVTMSARDVRSAVDRASGFLRVDARSRPGCALDTSLARALARAIVLRAAPALDEGTARSQAEYAAELATPCSSVPFEGGEEFQSHPERALADTWPEYAPAMGALFGRGASLAYRWIDWMFGRQPGSFVLATWALAATMTPVGAPRWNAEPDAYDVFRESFKGALSTNSTLDDLLLELAMARATLPADLPEAAPLGALAVARRDWKIDWPDKPRGLSFPTGVAPTGASILEVSCAGAPKNARLRLEARWEEHARMRWGFVRLDASGRPMSRVLVPSTPKATEAQMTLVDLDGVASVLVVGANVGAWEEPFDPDDAIWEPHGWTATLAAF